MTGPDKPPSVTHYDCEGQPIAGAENGRGAEAGNQAEAATLSGRTSPE